METCRDTPVGVKYGLASVTTAAGGLAVVESIEAGQISSDRVTTLQELHRMIE